MSLWWRSKPAATETRDVGMPQPLAALVGLFRQSFDQVDLSAAESNLQSVAVGSSVDLLASLTSELPADVFRGRGSQRTQLTMPGWLEDPDGEGHGLEDWIYRGVWSLLLRGNLFGDVLERGPGETLRQVDLFHPDRVTPLIEDGVVKWLANGREIRSMLHRRAFPVPGWVLGLSPVQYRMWTVGLNLSATRFGMQWFQDGAHPSAILRNTEVAFKDDEQPRRAKDAFMAALRGTREPVVLGKGWEWQKIQLTPDESQFLATQGYSAAECCRIFGPGLAEVLGYGSGMETGGSLTYSNLIDRDLHLLKYALNKWLRRMERLLSQFLPRPQYVRFNRDALLETDTLRRYQAYAIALDKRFKVVNEIRDKEELPPVPWGAEPNATPGAAPSMPAADEEPEGEGGQ